MARDTRKRAVFKGFFAVQVITPDGRYKWIFVPDDAQVEAALAKRTGWKLPDKPVELYCESRATVTDGKRHENIEAGPTKHESGLPVHARNGLAMALSYYLRAEVNLLYTDLDGKTTRHQIEIVEDEKEEKQIAEEKVEVSKG